MFLGGLQVQVTRLYGCTCQWVLQGHLRHSWANLQKTFVDASQVLNPKIPIVNTEGSLTRMKWILGPTQLIDDSSDVPV